MLPLDHLPSRVEGGRTSPIKHTSQPTRFLSPFSSRTRGQRRAPGVAARPQRCAWRRDARSNGRGGWTSGRRRRTAGGRRPRTGGGGGSCWRSRRRSCRSCGTARSHPAWPASARFSSPQAARAAAVAGLGGRSSRHQHRAQTQLQEKWTAATSLKKKDALTIISLTVHIRVFVQAETRRKGLGLGGEDVGSKCLYSWAKCWCISAYAWYLRVLVWICTLGIWEYLVRL